MTSLFIHGSRWKFMMHYGILKVYDYEEKVVVCEQVQAQPYQ